MFSGPYFVVRLWIRFHGARCRPEQTTEACNELRSLLATPSEIVVEAGPASTREMALDFVYSDKVGYDLKRSEKVTSVELAEGCALDGDDPGRMLPLAMVHHLFEATDDGMVRHTASSFLLANDTGLSAWVGLVMKENWAPHDEGEYLLASQRHET
ncbi:hypothetical protein GGR58DRAFT_503815 [Xylaria digitata]|nr:hypothetical protein GGR58DRAFT_503815 [Xylaria digitata]